MKKREETVTIDYTYDPLYRLTAADYSTGDFYHYAYDSVGNRLTQESTVSGLPSTVNYQYDNANRLTNAGGVNYTFDANGNLLSDGVNTYTYDSANRLVAVSGEQGVESSYNYNGLGDRLSQTTAGGVTTNYTLDLNTGLTQVLSDGTNTYTYGLGRISQTNTSTEYFLNDALGSVRQLTNVNAEITLAKIYDPYGNVMSTSGSGESVYAYTGESQDASGMVYLRARYYASNTGRFQSRDTWEGDANRPMSMNWWNYTNSNPVNLTDPSGHAPTSCIRGYNDLSTAEAYVPKDGSALTTYVAAGIAIQCWGVNVRDPRDPHDSGVGPAQVSDNQASTPYGESVLDDRGYGLRCYVLKASLPRDERDDLLSCECFTPEDIKQIKDFNQKYELGPILDPSDPNNAAALMRRRIEQVINNCINCSETDKFIAAALGQNGPGLTPGDMLTLSSWGKNNPFRPAKDDNIVWGSYFDDRINTKGYKGWFDTSYQLQLFFDFAKRLHHDGYYLPDIAGYLVRDLKNRKAP